MDRKRTQVLHLHGYGATTFGRLAAAMRGTAVLLHEHANHTTTPWFQQVADSTAGALHRPGDRRSRLRRRSSPSAPARCRPNARRSSTSARRSRSSAVRAAAEEIAAAREQLGIAPRHVRRRHGDAADAGEGQPVPDRGRPADRRCRCPTRTCTSPAKANCRRNSRRRRATWASPIASTSSASSATSRASCRAFDLVVFPSLWEGTPLTSFEALAMGKPIVSTDADGLCEILRDGVDAAIVPRESGRAIADAVVALERDPARERRSGRKRSGPAGATTSTRGCARWSACTS